MFSFDFTSNSGTTTGQDYGIRNQVAGGAADLIVWRFRVYLR